MFRQALSRVAKLLRTQHNTTQHNTLRSRLSLESLESREVPALYTWTGAMDTNAANMMNWQVNVSMQPGQPPAPPAGLPDGDDELIFNAFAAFDPLTGTSRNCNNLTSLTDSFAAVRIQGGYTGTVMLGESLTFGLFDLASGAISQPTVNRDLTVTGAFNWTGGVLNNSGNDANFSLHGGNATINPGVGSTLTTGSTLNLTNSNGMGSVTNVFAGTLAFANQATLRVGANSTLNFVESLNGAITHIDDLNIEKEYMWIDVNGTWNIQNAITSKIPLYNYYGTLTVSNQQTASFSGMIYENVLGIPTPFGSVYSIGGTNQIWGGANLVVQNGAFFHNSITKTVVHTLQPNNNVATITGNLVVKGGSLSYAINTAPGTPIAVFGRLEVTGDVYLIDTAFRPTVDLSNNNTSTSLRANTITLTGTVTIDPSLANNPPNGGNVGFEYKVLEATQIITGTLTNGRPLIFDLIANGNPVKSYTLKKK